MEPRWPACLEGSWRASLGRFTQISPGWRHYFQEILKLQPVKINAITPTLKKKKKQIAVIFRRIEMKPSPPLLFPFVLEIV